MSIEPSIASQIESIVIEKVADSLGDFPDIFITDASVRQPTSFPALQILLMDAPIDPAMRDSGGVDNAIVAKFEVNAYVDETAGGKSAVMKIADAVCFAFAELGFECKLRQPVANADASVRRMYMRFQAGVTRSLDIYRIK